MILIWRGSVIRRGCKGQTGNGAEDKTGIQRSGKVNQGIVTEKKRIKKKNVKIFNENRIRIDFEHKVTYNRINLKK